MTTNIGKFNMTLQEFLEELLETFPEHQGINKQKLKFEVGTRANCRLAVDKITPTLMKYANEIVQRNDSVITEVNGVFPEIDFVELWNSDISTKSRDVIWEYLNTLLVLGTMCIRT